jgi:hypothetical protein
MRSSQRLCSSPGASATPPRDIGNICLVLLICNLEYMCGTHQLEQQSIDLENITFKWKTQQNTIVLQYYMATLLILQLYR